MTSELLVLTIVLGASLLSVVAYVVSGASRREDLNEIRDRGGFVLGSFVRSWLYWFLGPVERIAVRVNAPPTAFNALGVLLGVSAGFCFGTGNLNPGGWLLLLSGAVDILDGRIARAQGLASPRGSFLDSTLDRFTEVGAFVGLAVFYHNSEALTVIVALALGGSLLVSYTRARGESIGVVCKVGIMQRAERLLLVGLGGILDPIIGQQGSLDPGMPLAAALILVAGGAMGTAAYRTAWIARRLL